MTEGQRSNTNSSRESKRRRSVVPQTPDVLKHREYRSQERTPSKQSSSSPSRQMSYSSKLPGNKWYSTGYPALRAADKKVREIHAKREAQKLARTTKAKRRARSYSRGRSVYFNDDDPSIPYYRSKSVDSIRRESSTFDPVVNEKEVINITYTGRISRENSAARASNGSRRGSIRSRRGSGIVQKKVESVVPHMRNEYDFNDLETRIYQQIQKVYGEPDADTRNKQFFQTLAQMQSDHLRMQRMKISKDDRMFLEKMFQEVTNMKKETGKILQNSSHRYSNSFMYPSPVNEKVLRLPRGRQREDFLTKIPRTRERLKLKPLRHRDPRGRDRKNYRTYEQYENYKHHVESGHINQFQRAKEPNNPSDMLKFLQHAERLLTEYNKGLHYKTDSNHHPSPYTIDHSIVNKHSKLKPIRQQLLSNNIETNQQYGRVSPRKHINITNISPTVDTKPILPVYKRPEAFYDGRKHQNYHNRASIVDHQMHKAKFSGDITEPRALNNRSVLGGFAT